MFWNPRCPPNLLQQSSKDKLETGTASIGSEDKKERNTFMYNRMRFMLFLLHFGPQGDCLKRAKKAPKRHPPPQGSKDCPQQMVPKSFT